MRPDAEADYSWLFRAHFRRIAQAVNLIVFDRARAEEIAQESFTQLWRKWSTVSAYERPEAWVRKVAIRLALRTAHRDRTRPRLERAQPVPAAESFPDRELAEAIRALAPRQRAAVVLFYLEDRPVSEIAQTLNVSESTVKQHLFRARAQLSKTLRRTKRRMIMSVDLRIREGLARNAVLRARGRAVFHRCCGPSDGTDVQGVPHLAAGLAIFAAMIIGPLALDGASSLVRGYALPRRQLRQWTAIPPGPLSARNGALGVWIADRFVIMGGTATRSARPTRAAATFRAMEPASTRAPGPGSRSPRPRCRSPPPRPPSSATWSIC